MSENIKMCKCFDLFECFDRIKPNISESEFLAMSDFVCKEHMACIHAIEMKRRNSNRNDRDTIVVANNALARANGAPVGIGVVGNQDNLLNQVDEVHAIYPAYDRPGHGTPAWTSQQTYQELLSQLERVRDEVKLLTRQPLSHSDRAGLSVSERSRLRELALVKLDPEIAQRVQFLNLQEAEIRQRIFDMDRSICDDCDRDILDFRKRAWIKPYECRCGDLFDIIDDLKEKLSSYEYKTLVELIGESHTFCKYKLGPLVLPDIEARRTKALARINEIEAKRGSETASDKSVSASSRFSDARTFWKGISDSDST